MNWKNITLIIIEANPDLQTLRGLRKLKFKDREIKKILRELYKYRHRFDEFFRLMWKVYLPSIRKLLSPCRLWNEMGKK